MSARDRHDGEVRHYRGDRVTDPSTYQMVCPCGEVGRIRARHYDADDDLLAHRLSEIPA